MSNFINDMINAARDNNPSGFESAFKDEVAVRVADGINDRRADVVSSILGIELNTSEAPVQGNEGQE